jgi:hypothetical protein
VEVASSLSCLPKELAASKAMVIDTNSEFAQYADMCANPNTKWKKDFASS